MKRIFGDKPGSKSIEKIFAEYDSVGDGRISVWEMHSALQAAKLLTDTTESTEDDWIHLVDHKDMMDLISRPGVKLSPIPKGRKLCSTADFPKSKYIDSAKSMKILQMEEYKYILAPLCLLSPTITVQYAIFLDSGANINAVGNALWLHSLEIFTTPKWAEQPDGSRLRVVGIGTLKLGRRFHVPDVYLVEGLDKNLISVGQLDKNHGMCCCFHSKRCEIMLPDGTLVGGGFQKDDGMYELYFLFVPPMEE